MNPTKIHNRRLKKTLRQALDILAAKQFEANDKNQCLACKAQPDEDHKNGCRAESVFKAAEQFGLNYISD